jgi:hypothetical protein
MTTICGHERDVLIWALGFVDSPAVHHCRLWESGQYNAAMDVHGPVKLAEMLAEEGRRLGFATFVGRNATIRGDARRPWLVFEPGGERFPIVCEGEVDELDGCICMIGESFTMPQARALLLAWIVLPDGDRKQAMSVLQSNDIDLDKLPNDIPFDE